MSGAIRVLLTCEEEHPERLPGHLHQCMFTYWGEVLGANSHALHMRVDRFLDDAYSAHPRLAPVRSSWYLPSETLSTSKVWIPWSRIVNIGTEGEGWSLHAPWVDDDEEFLPAAPRRRPSEEATS